MNNPPVTPRKGEPIKADWAENLVRWIKDAVMPRGDGCTIIAKGNVLSVTGVLGAAKETDGPFAVTDSSDEETAELTIAEGFYRHGLIHCLVPQSLVYPEETGYVYIKITNDGNRYIFESDCAATLPASESGTLYVPLAYVTVKDGAVEKITQWQYGELLTPGVM